MRYSMRHFRQTHVSYQCAKRKQKRTSVDIAIRVGPGLQPDDRELCIQFQAEAKIPVFRTAFTPPPEPSRLPSNAYHGLFPREQSGAKCN